jgi:hypothetical protein
MDCTSQRLKVTLVSRRDGVGRYGIALKTGNKKCCVLLTAADMLPSREHCMQGKWQTMALQHAAGDIENAPIWARAAW